MKNKFILNAGKYTMSLIAGLLMVVLLANFSLVYAATDSDGDNINASESSYNRDSKYFSIDVGIPLSGNITPNNIQKWLTNMDKVYESYQSLTGFTPCNGQTLTFVSSTETYGAAWIHPGGNPNIYINVGAIPEWYGRINTGCYTGTEDWLFGYMHEIGHMFDTNIWDFDSELMANFKMAYVLEKQNAPVIMGKQYWGAEIKDYYYTNNYIGTDGLTSKFGGDAFTYTLLDIKDKIGWEPFESTFRKMLDMTKTGFELSKSIDKLNMIFTSLRNESGYDVISYYSDAQIAVLENEYGGTIKYLSTVGDTNVDGKIDVLDCTKFQRELTTNLNLSKIYDADGNNLININDITAIQKYISKIEFNSNVGTILLDEFDSVQIRIFDNTSNSWLKNDGAEIYIKDNSTGIAYKATTTDNISWTCNIPAENASLTIERRNPKDGSVWNSWSTSFDLKKCTFIINNDTRGYWVV